MSPLEVLQEPSRAFCHSYLRRAWLIAALAVLSCAVGTQSVAGSEADELLARVRSALPEVPLRIEAELQARDRRGTITQVAPVEMKLDWGAVVPRAVYTVFDRFGTPRERMTVEWPGNGDTRVVLERGDPLEEVADPEVDATIGTFDLTWADLQLPFLWWPNGRRVGSERVRGRYCHIIEITAPADAFTAYAAARLWIDPETALLLQADALDARGRAVRRVQIRSLRQIDEQWMVQNIDIFNHATRERVTLRVRDLDRLPNERRPE